MIHCRRLGPPPAKIEGGPAAVGRIGAGRHRGRPPSPLSFFKSLSLSLFLSLTACHRASGTAAKLGPVRPPLAGPEPAAAAASPPIQLHQFHLSLNLFLFFLRSARHFAGVFSGQLEAVRPPLVGPESAATVASLLPHLSLFNFTFSLSICLSVSLCLTVSLSLSLSFFLTSAYTVPVARRLNRGRPGRRWPSQCWPRSYSTNGMVWDRRIPVAQSRRG